MTPETRANWRSLRREYWIGLWIGAAIGFLVRGWWH